jgi:sRNA-binding carbon storage regulator CsrA
MFMLTRRIGDIVRLDLPDNHSRVEIHLDSTKGADIVILGIDAPKTVRVTSIKPERQPSAVLAT